MTTNGLPDSPESKESGLLQAEEKANRFVQDTWLLLCFRFMLQLVQALNASPWLLRGKFLEAVTGLEVLCSLKCFFLCCLFCRSFQCLVTNFVYWYVWRNDPSLGVGPYEKRKNVLVGYADFQWMGKGGRLTVVALDNVTRSLISNLVAVFHLWESSKNGLLICP